MSERRTQITTLAREAVQRSGLHSVSFRQLADDIGIKSSSVHYHFPTKSDLAEALITEYTDHFLVVLHDIERTNDTLTEKLNALVAIFESVTKADNLCLCGMMATELAELDERSKKALQKFFAETENWLEGLFERNKSSLNIGLSPEQLAQVFVSSLEGAMLLDRADDDNKRLAAIRALVHVLTS